MKIEHKRHTDNANSITFSNGAYALFSYETLVAFCDGHTDYRDENKYSRTTSKHLARYARTRHDNEAKLISQSELQNKLKAYMANHVIKDVLGEII